MDEYIQRAERFLKAIAERADKARLALEQDNWDAYEDAMKWKTAAFHHFRSVDFILEAGNPDYLKDERWQKFWIDIQSSEEALAQRIENYQKNLNQTLLKIRKTKRAVGRYHSGEREEAGFIEGV